MIALYEYSLRFKQPFRTADRIFTHRKGLLLRYHDKQLDVASEIAPLPGYSGESLDELVRGLPGRFSKLKMLLMEVTGTDQIKTFLDKEPFPPSAQFGISCLSLHLASARNPAAFERPPFTSPETPLQVNGLIGNLPDNEVCKEITELYATGFRTIKIKCEFTPGRLPGIIRDFSALYPDLLFRIDPNRSWPIGNAAGYLEKFSGLPVEYCEEPCLFRSLDEFRKLKKISPVPLALDESLSDMKTYKEVISTEAADVVIIKPMLMGNILELIETCSKKETHSIKKVCTTSLESGVGRNSVTHLASLIGSPNAAHGLDTGRFLYEDLYENRIHNGFTGSGDYSFWCVPFGECHTENLDKINQL